MQLLTAYITPQNIAFIFALYAKLRGNLPGGVYFNNDSLNQFSQDVIKHR